MEAYLHAYAVAFYRDNDLNRGNSVNTFDLHYFNVIVGANISDKIASEVLLEYEHSGDETEVRYGVIDYKIAEPAILRFEPVVRYGQADLDDGSGHDIQRSTVGLVFYPNPELHPMFNFKISQSFIHDDGTGDREHEFVAQCVIGF